jgi:hypothetical protein
MKNKNTKWVWILSIIGVLVIGGIFLWGNGTSITIKHPHGLGYSNDGKRIIIPAHDGLRVYSGGQWEIPEGERHDYMGFSKVDDGFYSSGHPADGSELPNPFGVIKSTDEGKTIQMLDLKGETDFHKMAVGYKTHTIYVLNYAPNSKMDTPGMYYTKDETETWVKSDIKGLNENPTFVAAHPIEDGVVAVGTPGGVYLSKDYGNNFEKVYSDLQVTSLFFNHLGQLLIGGVNPQPLLLQLDIKSLKSEEIGIPTLREKDFIVFIAQNLVNENELVFATFDRDVYISNDSGENWTAIAEKGQTISLVSP